MNSLKTNPRFVPQLIVITVGTALVLLFLLGVLGINPRALALPIGAIVLLGHAVQKRWRVDAAKNRLIAQAKQKAGQ